MENLTANVTAQVKTAQEELHGAAQHGTARTALTSGLLPIALQALHQSTALQDRNGEHAVR